MSTAADRDDRRPAPSGGVLMVGLVCLDIVNSCDRYPLEDEDLRARDQHWTTGGNASNSSKVLSLLGRKCEFLGTLGRGMETEFAVSQLDSYGIAHHNCVYHPQCKLPTSCIVLSLASGSRTIVHYRNLPELTLEDFKKVNLSSIQWIHFEARNPSEYSKIVEHIRKTSRETAAATTTVTTDPNRHVTVSIEIEKTKPELRMLIPLADVLFVSKEFARFQGYASMQDAVIGLRSQAKQGAIIICAWGELGAAASDKDSQVYASPAFPPEKLVDTLGAGDTFNAAVIHSLLQGKSVREALTYACKLAGAKCGMVGFNGLKNYDPS